MMIEVQTPEARPVVFVGLRLRDGTMVLVPQPRQPRSCHTAAGVPKLAFSSRRDARRRADVDQHPYACSICGAFHLATRRLTRS
jgi:hypothetical protein